MLIMAVILRWKSTDNFLNFVYYSFVINKVLKLKKKIKKIDTLKCLFPYKKIVKLISFFQSWFIYWNLILASINDIAVDHRVRKQLHLFKFNNIYVTKIY